ncbi:MAG: hypothetical protein RR778_07855, partial [Glutamicibacter sp.]
IKAQMQTSNLMLTQDECDELMRRMEEVIPAFREDLKNGKVTSSQPAGDREIWHVMSLFNADSLLNESQEGDQSS